MKYLEEEIEIRITYAHTIRSRLIWKNYLRHLRKIWLKLKKRVKRFIFTCVLISCLFNLWSKMRRCREEQIQMSLKTIWSDYVITLKSKFHHFLSVPSIFILISLAMRLKRKKSITSIEKTLRILTKWFKTSKMHFIDAKLVFY